MIQLPQGWKESLLGEVVDYGKTKKAEASDIPSDAWLLELEDIEKNSSRLLKKVRSKDRDAKSTKNVFKAGDVLYGKLRPYLNKVIVADEDGYCSTEIIPISPTKQLDAKFLFYSLKRKEFLDYVQQVSHGIRMPRLGTKQGKQAPFIEVPVDEQKRIADKLDSVLAKVEAAQARLDKIPTILKRFRQSVLAAATSGELTKDWREENGKALEDWEVKELKEICYSISDGDHQAPPKAESGIPFLVISNISAGYLNFDAVSRWVPEEYYDSLKNIRKPEKGDILYTVTGSFGIPLIVNVDEDFCFQRHIAIIKPDNEIVDTEFLKYFLESPSMYKHATKVATGTAQKTVSLTNLRQFQICLPTNEEQLAISNKVVELFEHAKTVEKQYYASKIRLDKLTQSILARAFRGDLFLPLSESTAIHHGNASSDNSSEKTDSTELNADLVSDMPESSTVDKPKADQVSAKRANGDDLEYEKKSEVLKLLRANKKSSRSAQEIFDSNQLNTFETIDNIFIELKTLLKLNLIEQLGNGSNTKFKAK